MNSYKIPAIFLALIMLGGAVGISAANNTLKAQNPFEISSEQSAADQSATIKVKIATNNTVVIPPNGTIIEVPGNITQVDNDTVVIAPDNETITEVPGNVTVITPPEPEPCGCPAANETGIPEGGGIPPVNVQPAPGQEVVIENATIVATNDTGIIVEGQGNITSTDNQTTVEPEPVPPVDNTNQTQPAEPTTGNETASGGGTTNDTGLSPASFQQLPKNWWEI